MNANFQQGEDQKLSVLVIENGSPVDVSACANIKAILKVGGVEQKKYALVAETDHGTLLVDNTNNNQVNIFVTRDESKLFTAGSISIVLVCPFVDTSFPGNVRHQEYKFNVGRIIEGEAKDLTI